MALGLWLFDRYRRLPVFFFSLSIVAILLFANTTNWDLFDWLKRSFIIGPALLLAIAQYITSKTEVSNRFIPVFFAGAGFANVLIFMVGDIYYGRYGNGLFALALLITFPFKFSIDRTGVVGFKDPFWVIMFCICDFIFIHFYPGIKNAYYFVSVILVVVPVMLILVGDWHKAFSFRIYSLAPFLVMDTLFDFISDYAYPPVFHPSARNDPMVHGWVDMAAGMMGVMVICRWIVLRRKGGGTGV